MRPQDAEAQGLLACALMINAGNVNRVGSSTPVEDAKRAADASLRPDPNNPNARLARIQLERPTLDLAGTEDGLRNVLASAPDNIFAMRLLWNLLQSAGRSRDALQLVQRAIAIRPLAAANNFPLGQLLWIVGRIAEADRVIDRAMQFWPTHRYVRFARFTIFTFTGRPRAALAMLDSNDTRPQGFSPAGVALWRVSLPALDHPSASNIATARRASLDAVKRDPELRLPGSPDFVITWRSRCRARDCKRPAGVPGAESVVTQRGNRPTAGQQHSLEIYAVVVHAARSGASRRSPFQDPVRRDRIDRLLDAPRHQA